jgi:outer membrane protein TolC
MVLALLPTALLAQEQGHSLREAITIALASSPLLQATRYQVEATTAGIERARAAFLPRLDLSESFTYADNPVFAFGAKLNQGRFAESDFDVRRLNNPAPERDFKTGVTLQQPLFTGGKATLGLRQARLQHQASTYHLDRQQQQVVFEVVRAYYGIVRAQADLQVIRAALQVAVANRDFARERFRTGLVVASDVLSASVRLAGLQEQEIAASNQVTLAQATLNDVMGRPLDEPFVVTEPLHQRPNRHQQPQELEILALQQRPDYQQLQTTEQVLEHSIALARTAYLPTVGLTANYEVHNHNLVSDGQESWFVAVGVQWNVFNGLGDRARIAEAQANAAQCKAMRQRAASRIQLEVKEAFLGLQTAQQRIDVATGAITQAEEALRIVRDRYQVGLTTIVALLADEAALTRAQGNLTQALYDYNVGLAGLELALGTIGKDAF